MPIFPHPVAPRVYFDAQMPSSVSEAAEEIFIKWAHLIPSWCEYIEVFWDESAGQSAAYCEAKYDYARANVTLGPNFMSRADRREAYIVHELLHIQLEPLANTMKDIRDFLKEHHKETSKLFDELVRHAEERTVSSLTATLIPRLP